MGLKSRAKLYQGLRMSDSGGFVDYGAYETNGRGIIDVYACPGDDIGIDPFGITAPVWNNGDQGSTDVGLGKYWGIRYRKR